MIKITPRLVRTLRALLFLFVLTFAPRAWAQQAETDTTGWQKDLTAILAGSQASYNNWAEGGINSLAFAANLNGHAKKVTTNWLMNHELRLAFGLLKQDTLELRKADDLIQYTGTFEYTNENAFAKWHPTAALTFRTQFADGFDYKANPEAKVSSFLSPLSHRLPQK